MARELCETIKITELRPATQPRKPFLHTASALLVMGGGGSKIICVYCKGELYSAACEVLKDITAHSELLRKEGRCFLCLSKGHRVNLNQKHFHMQMMAH